jgi:hypothetical protein
MLFAVAGLAIMFICRRFRSGYALYERGCMGKWQSRSELFGDF